MASLLDEPITTEMTAWDLYDRFGPMPLRRIVFDPAPGTATFDDLLDRYHRTGRFCELVDGILLEKDVSYEASRIAMELGGYLREFIKPRKLGILTGEQGFLRLTTDRVRGPDVAFVAWDRFPGGYDRKTLVPNLAPTLAVEVISPGNTKREMDEKLAEYFRTGVDLVWYMYPEREEVVAYTDIDEKAVLGKNETLNGGTALPGFSRALAELFAEP